MVIDQRVRLSGGVKGAGFTANNAHHRLHVSKTQHGFNLRLKILSILIVSVRLLVSIDVIEDSKRCPIALTL